MKKIIGVLLLICTFILIGCNESTEKVDNDFLMKMSAQASILEALNSTDEPTNEPVVNPEEGNPEEGNAEEGNPEEGNPEEGNPEEGNAEEGNPEEGNTEETVDLKEQFKEKLNELLLEYKNDKKALKEEFKNACQVKLQEILGTELLAKFEELKTLENETHELHEVLSENEEYEAICRLLKALSFELKKLDNETEEYTLKQQEIDALLLTLSEETKVQYDLYQAKKEECKALSEELTLDDAKQTVLQESFEALVMEYDKKADALKEEYKLAKKALKEEYIFECEDGEKHGDYPKDGEKHGDCPKDEEKQGNCPKDEEKQGNCPKDGEKQGDYPKDGEKHGNCPRDGEKQGNCPRDGEKQGDYPKDGEKQGDYPRDGEKQGDCPKDGNRNK